MMPYQGIYSTKLVDMTANKYIDGTSIFDAVVFSSQFGLREVSLKRRNPNLFENPDLLSNI